MCIQQYVSLLDNGTLSPRARVLYLRLLAIAEKEQSQTIWFKQAELAEFQKISVRTLQRVLKELVDKSMIVKKEEKHEKKYPAYQILQAEREGVEQKRSEIVFETRTNSADQKLVAERLIDTVEVCEKLAPVPTPTLIVKQPTLPTPAYKYPPPPERPLAPGETRYDPKPVYLKSFFLPCPPTGEVEMARCENVLTMTERMKLSGTESVSMIPAEKLPFTLEMLIGLYGDKLEERFPYLDGEDGCGSIASVLHCEMSRTLWLKYIDPLDFLYKVLGIEDKAALFTKQRVREKREQEQKRLEQQQRQSSFARSGLV